MKVRELKEFLKEFDDNDEVFVSMESLTRVSYASSTSAEFYEGIGAKDSDENGYVEFTGPVINSTML